MCYIVGQGLATDRNLVAVDDHGDRKQNHKGVISFAVYSFLTALTTFTPIIHDAIHLTMSPKTKGRDTL